MMNETPIVLGGVVSSAPLDGSVPDTMGADLSIFIGIDLSIFMGIDLFMGFMGIFVVWADIDAVESATKQKTAGATNRPRKWPQMTLVITHSFLIANPNSLSDGRPPSPVSLHRRPRQ